MNVTVLGAGAWGTALAISAARRQARVMLWARDVAQASHMQQARCNERYLGPEPFPEQLTVTSDWDAAIAHAAPDGLIVIGTPMAALADMLARMPAQAPVVWLCKGFDKASGRLGHEIAAAVRPNAPSGVLSGPSFALEVARAQPTALVSASADPALAELAAQAFHSDSLRVYTSTDPVGVEVGGAVKNVLAIATGLCDGLQLGLNARAALITRGLAEMTRLGLALGARSDTFMGLSGLGDLVLTATGDLSRNRKVGQLLAQGKTLQEAVDSLGHVAEGVYCARTVVQRAQHLGVDMPIAHSVVALLDGKLTAQQVVRTLMARDPKAEA
ncbi:MAG: hypothetical protein RLZZ182_27 [Pseudomonadota bacterium]